MPHKDPEKRRQYQREYKRRWYQANKAKHIALVRGREKRIKAWLREYKESLGCEACGEKHPACLEFHHTNRQEKRFAIGRLKDYLSLKCSRPRSPNAVCCARTATAKSTGVNVMLRLKPTTRQTENGLRLKKSQTVIRFCGKNSGGVT